MRVVKYIIAILAFIIVGFFIQKSFMEFSYAMVKTDNVIFENRLVSKQFYSNLLFSLAIGSVPILYLIIRKITKIHFFYKGVIAVGLLIGTGIISWLLRVFYINRELKFLSSVDFLAETKLTYPINEFYFEYFLFLGFVVGTLVSILIFRIKKKTT
jgi:hypothetical protein